MPNSEKICVIGIWHLGSVVSACMADLGYSMVEILSPCPTNWKMLPVDACKWVEESTTKTFPLKVIKDEVGKI